MPKACGEVRLQTRHLPLEAKTNKARLPLSRLCRLGKELQLALRDEDGIDRVKGLPVWEESLSRFDCTPVARPIKKQVLKLAQAKPSLCEGTPDLVYTQNLQ